MRDLRIVTIFPGITHVRRGWRGQIRLAGRARQLPAFVPAAQRAVREGGLLPTRMTISVARSRSFMFRCSDARLSVASA
jgi:hypothetical protein